MYGLRKALDVKGRLSTGRNDYTFTLLEGDVLDLHRFQELTQQARRSRAVGDAGATAMLLRRALDIWDDPPLADVPATSAMRPLIAKLLEQRATAQEDLVEASLALGQHHSLLPFLMSLTTAQPLRERRWGQLMLALYQCGRQAEALETFSRARMILTQEHGIEPGSALQNLQQLILAGERVPHAPSPAQDQAWAVPSGGSRPHAAPVPSRPTEVPRQLPAAPRHFIGRTAELKALRELAGEVSPAGSSPVVAVLSGAAGIGKTALALGFAHQAADLFPDGQLYIDLGSSPTADVQKGTRQAIRSVLAPLTPLASPIAMAPNAEVNLYRTVLAKRRMLILIDNAYSSEQVLPLIPASPLSMVIITSRLKLTDLVTSHSAQLITLETLSPVEAERLLASRLRASHLTVDEAVLAEISELCAQLPLSLVKAATQAVARPMFSLYDLARELRGEQGALSALALPPDP